MDSSDTMHATGSVVPGEYSVSPDALFKCLSMTFPPSMAQLVQELVAPVPDFDTIARVLESDPVLAATVLTLVNSPYYGLSTKVIDLQRAAVVLGTKEILKIALSISYHQNISKSAKRDQASMFADWRLVVWSSIAAEQIALRISPENSQFAYLSSLLKDLSLFLQECVLSSEEAENALCTTYSECLTALKDDQLEQESLVWGNTHAELTSALLREWHLPDELLEGILAHHDIGLLDTASPLAQAVILATRWAELLHGSDPEANAIIPFEILLMRQLEMDAAALEELRSQCVQKFQSVLQLLAIEEAAANLQYYRHSLQAMQGFYFNGIELTNTSGGIDALALAFGRQLRWNLGLAHAEIALQIPNTQQYQLFRMEENALIAPVGGPVARQALNWTVKGEKLLLGDAQQNYCELHYLPADLSNQQRNVLPVFTSFASQALTQYYQDRAVMENKAHTLDTLPVGVALLNTDGRMIEGNDKLRMLLQLDGQAAGTEVIDFFVHKLSIPLDKMISELAGSEERQTISQLYCTTQLQSRTKAPCVYLSLHKTEKPDQQLLLLEDVTEITEIEVQVLRQRDFLEQLIASMRELLVTVNGEGEIIWTAPGWAYLKGKNLFSVTAPGPSFAGVWDASLLAETIPAMPVEATFNDELGEKAQLELVFSPLGSHDGNEASVLVVGRDLTTIRRLEGEIRRQAMFDGLTGLLNHKHCKTVLDREVERSRRTGRTVGLIFFDLDRFKNVNDTYGHQAGDRILKLTARAMTESLRKGMDFPCRYGGDEFAIITTEVTKDIMEMLGHRIRAAIRKHCRDVVDASIGMAMLRGEESGEQLLRRADSASYKAKQEGGTNAVWAD